MIRKFLIGVMVDLVGPVLTLFVMFIAVFVIIFTMYAVSGAECRSYEKRDIYNNSFIKRCMISWVDWNSNYSV